MLILDEAHWAWDVLRAAKAQAFNKLTLRK